MIHTGLCSITFRDLPPKEIVQLVSKAGLDSIEWGGDVHVPHGDLTKAREVRAITEDAGIEIVSYGSYYKVGVSENNGLTFESVLATAVELCAPNIRVWAGDRGSEESEQGYIDQVIADSIRIADMAVKESVTVSYEYHVNTLTDTLDSALGLLNIVDHPNMLCYWQPPFNSKVEQNLEAIAQLLPWLSIIHVFYWPEGPEVQFRPLSEGAEKWSKYLSALASSKNTMYTLLEFVRDNSPHQFLEDARTLQTWLKQTEGQGK